MLAALAGVVHDRQRAYGREHYRDESDDKGGLHFDLAAAEPPGPPARIFTFETEPTVNEPVFSGAPDTTSDLCLRNRKSSFTHWLRQFRKIRGYRPCPVA